MLLFEYLVAKEPQTQAPGDAKDTPANIVADQATQDATPEVGEVEETPEGTPMEEAEEGGTAEASIDEDYVEDVTTAQGTWDAWPTSTQYAPITPHDDPTPAQDD